MKQMMECRLPPRNATTSDIDKARLMGRREAYKDIIAKLTMLRGSIAQNNFPGWNPATVTTSVDGILFDLQYLVSEL